MAAKSLLHSTLARLHYFGGRMETNTSTERQEAPCQDKAATYYYYRKKVDAESFSSGRGISCRPAP